MAVGIGTNLEENQLLTIARTPSNIILIEKYADLPKFVKFISNYFCKQIMTIKVNQTINGNRVRVVDSPSYFRV